MQRFLDRSVHGAMDNIQTELAKYETQITGRLHDACVPTFEESAQRIEALAHALLASTVSVDEMRRAFEQDRVAHQNTRPDDMLVEYEQCAWRQV